MKRHLRLAKPAIVMICLGFLAGLASTFALRGWGVFSTVHSLVSTTSLLLFVATGVLGRALEKGRSRNVELHAGLALASLGTAVAAFFTGFVLLP